MLRYVLGENSTSFAISDERLIQIIITIRLFRLHFDENKVNGKDSKKDNRKNGRFTHFGSQV